MDRELGQTWRVWPLHYRFQRQTIGDRLFAQSRREANIGCLIAQDDILIRTGSILTKMRSRHSDLFGRPWFQATGPQTSRQSSSDIASLAHCQHADFSRFTYRGCLIMRFRNCSGFSFYLLSCFSTHSLPSKINRELRALQAPLYHLELAPFPNSADFRRPVVEFRLPVVNSCLSFCLRCCLPLLMPRYGRRLAAVDRKARRLGNVRQRPLSDKVMNG